MRNKNQLLFKASKVFNVKYQLACIRDAFQLWHFPTVSESAEQDEHISARAAVNKLNRMVLRAGRPLYVGRPPSPSFTGKEEQLCNHVQEMWQEC